ncbi:MAG: 5'-nucleotidase, partial [Clostridia bacterium]
GKDGRNNGKGICGRLYKGDVTYLDIKRILPDLRHEEKGVLWKIKMTGENLIRALEYSLTVDNHKAGWFYYFSGLVMEYAPSFPQGSRIRKITDIEGKPIDKTRIYSVAVSDYSVDESLVLSCEKTDVSIFSIFEGALSILHSISPSGDHRFKVYNEYKK